MNQSLVSRAALFLQPVQEVYDKSWTKGGYPAQSCWGCRFGADVVTRLPFHSVLDAGTGNGALVRLMRKHGALRLSNYCGDRLQVMLCALLVRPPYMTPCYQVCASALRTPHRVIALINTTSTLLT